MKLTLSFQSIWPKTQDKNVYTWGRKELFRWNKKHFSLLQRASIVANKIFFLEGVRKTLRKVKPVEKYLVDVVPIMDMEIFFFAWVYSIPFFSFAFCP